MALFRGDFKTKSLNRRSSISVILPVDNRHYFHNYEEKVEKPYRTLYLLHGMFGNNEIFLENTTIKQFAEDNHLAIVLPSGENSYYLDNEDKHELFDRYVGEELVEFTREVFPLSHKKEDTYIAGFSMGGYGALRIGLKYNDTFGAIGGISSALVTENFENLNEDDEYLLDSRRYFQSVFGDLDNVKKSDKNLKYLIEKVIQNDIEIPSIFLAIGKDDYFIEENKDFSKFLTKNGVEHIFKIHEGEHTWDFCDEHIKEFINWLNS